MKLKLLIALSGLVLSLNTQAQSSIEYVQKGEFGVTLGAGHYFGDLNTKAGLTAPNPLLEFFIASNLEII